jgi:hypothetical protein
VLTKDLLRVSRRGGGYRPLFAGPEREELAGRVLGAFQGHVGRERADLEAALADLETEAEDFKLVRGFAKLLEREATFETAAALPPERVRRTAFEAAEEVGVVTESERAAALAAAGERLGLEAAAVADALHADREARQVLAAVDARWTPGGLVAQYNLSLAQTALFDATRVTVRTADPRGLVTAVKRLGLLYEMYWDDGEQVVELTGPDALFRRTRRYGTRFARLLRAVVRAPEWELEAEIDDRGTERTMRLSDEDPIRVPEADPVAEVEYDSGVEREFAARFEGLDLDWELVREPAFLEAGEHLMVPDFVFDYRPGGGDGGTADGSPPFRVYFEVMGFWTPAYVEKKLSQLEAVEEELIVAVDESLGAGEDVEARDHRVVPYTGSVRVKDVVDVLRTYEADLVAESAAALPDELVPEDDAVALADLADRRGVGEDALAEKAFPAHELVGRTLVRPAVLEAAAGEIEAGMDYAAAERALAERGIEDASAALAALGYRVEWAGLEGGTVREKA